MGNTVPPLMRYERDPDILGTKWKNNMIDRANRKDRDRDKHIIQVLLLGAGESGKSTLLKQMKIIYTKASIAKKTKLEKETIIRSMRVNIIDDLRELMTAAERFGLIFPEKMRPEQRQFFEIFRIPEFSEKNTREKQMERILPITDEKLDILELWWEDENVQMTWTHHRNEIQVQDSLPHFMNKMKAIFTPHYEPTEEDWLRVRVRTTGVTEEVFSIDGVDFKIIDVGGQRSERNKWYRSFENVTAVIFVIAVNEYDQALFEDTRCNRLLEGLDVFEKTVANEAFIDMDWIIFMNKTDLYNSKIKVSPIRHEDPDPSKSRFLSYTGLTYDMFIAEYGDVPDSSEEYKNFFNAGLEYFEGLMRERAKTKEDRIAVFHRTCAMDSHNIQVVFKTVRTLIINEILGAQGFIR